MKAACGESDRVGDQDALVERTCGTRRARQATYFPAIFSVLAPEQDSLETQNLR